MPTRTASLLIAFWIGVAQVLPASAQAPYPNHPIRIVVPFGPGGFADITVRVLGQKLTERGLRHRAVEIAAQDHAVRSGHGVFADLDHGAV